MSRQLSTRQRAPSRPRSCNNNNSTFDKNVLKDAYIFRNTPSLVEVDLNTCELGWTPFLLEIWKRDNKGQMDPYRLTRLNARTTADPSRTNTVSSNGERVSSTALRYFEDDDAGHAEVLALEAELKKRGVDHNYFNGASTEVENDEVTDERIMIGSSDFSHAPCAIDKILGKKQNYSAYMYPSAPSSGQEQAPAFTVLVLPTSYGPPTNSALRLADDELVLFSSLGLIWEQSKHNPRLFYLTKKPGLASISENDLEIQEVTPFLPDLRTKKGKLFLDHVSFEFKDAHGTIVKSTRDCAEPLDAFVNKLFDDHFRRNQSEGELHEDATKKYLKREIKLATERARSKKKAGHDFHFRNVNYTSKEVKHIKRYVFTPVNSPTSTEMPIKSGRCVDLFFKQQGKKSTYVNHHFSLFPEKGLRSRVKLELENEFDFDQNLNWIHHILLFDFADAIQYQINSEAKLDLLVKTYLYRLLDYIGINPKLQGSAQYFTRLIADCKKIISEVGRWPEHATDFLRAFLFRGLPRTRQSNSTCNVELPDKLRLNSSGTIEVQSGSSDDWEEIGLDALNNRSDGEGFLSDEGTISLLLQLAYLPIETPVGIGAACFKQSLLLAPHIDEASKDEIRKHIPPCEESFSKIADLLGKEVQTVMIEEVDTQFAMTSKEMMIGVFFRGQRKHCVFINGELGTISDPIPEYGQNEERSAETLKKLHINDGFHEVFVVKRIRLGPRKFRKLCNKRKNF